MMTNENPYQSPQTFGASDVPGDLAKLPRIVLGLVSALTSAPFFVGAILGIGLGILERSYSHVLIGLASAAIAIVALKVANWLLRPFLPRGYR